MNLQVILFWIFSIAMLASGVLVITRHNPVNSAMFLIQLFLCMAGLFVLLEAFFLAIVQILVYAGAVMVLFLFVIMLLNADPAQEKIFPRLSVFGATALSVVLGLEFYILLQKPIPLPRVPSTALSAGLRDVIKPLFTDYLLPFGLTSLIVLVAMVGVIVLSKRDVTSP